MSLLRAAVVVLAAAVELAGGTGTVHEKSLGGGETHRYAVPMAAGEFCRFSVDQHALDLAVALVDSAGQRELDQDNPTGRVAPEQLSVVAAEAGTYFLEVRAVSESAPPRSYRLTTEVCRPATDEDRRQAAWDRDLAAADRLYDQGTADAFTAALDTYRTLLAAGSEPLILYRIGLTQLRLNRPAEARTVWQEALALAREGEDRRVEAGLLNQLGRAGRVLGEGAAAAESFGAALILWQELRDPGSEASTLNNLALLQQGLGQPEAALASYQRALALYRQEGNRALAATVLNNLGGLLDLLGRLPEAIDHYEQALALAREMGQKNAEADVSNNLGAAYSQVGQPREAIERYTTALAGFRALGDRRREATAFNNLGHLLLDLGSPEEARELLRQALPLRQAMEPGGEALFLSNLGRAERDLGHFDRAVELYDQALAVARQGGDRTAEATTLNSLAFLHLNRREPGKAEPLLVQALALGRELGDAAAEGLAQRGIGQLRLLQGKPGAAEAFAEALRLAEATGDVSEQGRVLLERARGERERGELAAARTDLAAALERVESLRSELAGDRLRAAHFAAVREIYELYIDVLMQLKEPRLAFAAAERARARGLLDVLGQARVELRSGDPALLAEEQRLRREIASRASRPKGKDAVAALLAQYQLVDARLRASDLRWEGLRQPELGVEEVQRDLLKPGTLLLEISLGEPRSYLWAVSSTGFRTYPLPGRGRIEALARQVHASLEHPQGDGKARAELGRLLLGPLAPLPREARLVVVPEGALLYVPFAALSPRPGAPPLIESHEVVQLPSAAVLRAIRKAAAGRPRPSGAAAVLADPAFGPELPRLPWSRREAEVLIAQAGKRDVLSALGTKATRELALSPRMQRYRILHFATHGVLDTRHPELSALALSQGSLRLQDIYRMQLRADLVVLSGCETALGQRLRGEGLIGLTHGFLYAGASQVMASLWAVQDRATAELMQRFYRALFHDGLRPAAALRAAQRSLRSEPQWRDPHFWAAFVLQGDWQAAAR